MSLGVARDRAHDRAWRIGRADRTEPFGPLEDDAGDVGHRLDVVDQRRRLACAVLTRQGHPCGGVAGWRVRIVEAATVRRRDPGEGVSALDDLLERRFLTEQVVGRPLDDTHGDVVESVCLELGDRRPQASDLGSERRLDRQDDLGRSHGPGRDECTLQHPVRVASDDRAVLERARFAFGRIDDDGRGFDRTPAVGHRPPLDTGGEAGATPSAQSGIGDAGNQVVGFSGDGEGQCPPASSGEVRGEGGNGFGIEDTLNRRHGRSYPIASSLNRASRCGSHWTRRAHGAVPPPAVHTNVAVRRGQSDGGAVPATAKPYHDPVHMATSTFWSAGGAVS